MARVTRAEFKALIERGIERAGVELSPDDQARLRAVGDSATRVAVGRWFGPAAAPQMCCPAIYARLDPTPANVFANGFDIIVHRKVGLTGSLEIV
jgi:hypothetical protein